MLQEPQATLHNDVLKDRSWWDVDRAALSGNNDDGALERNTATQIDSTSDGQVVELYDLRDAGDARLEARDLLEVAAELDERCRAEAVRVDDELAVL